MASSLHLTDIEGDSDLSDDFDLSSSTWEIFAKMLDIKFKELLDDLTVSQIPKAEKQEAVANSVITQIQQSVLSSFSAHDSSLQKLTGDLHSLLVKLDNRRDELQNDGSTSLSNIQELAAQLSEAVKSCIQEALTSAKGDDAIPSLLQDRLDQFLLRFEGQSRVTGDLGAAMSSLGSQLGDQQLFIESNAARFEERLSKTLVENLDSFETSTKDNLNGVVLRVSEAVALQSGAIQKQLLQITAGNAQSSASTDDLLQRLHKSIEGSQQRLFEQIKSELKKKQDAQRLQIANALLERNKENFTTQLSNLYEQLAKSEATQRKQSDRLANYEEVRLQLQTKNEALVDDMKALRLEQKEAADEARLLRQENEKLKRELAAAQTSNLREVAWNAQKQLLEAQLFAKVCCKLLSENLLIVN